MTDYIDRAAIMARIEAEAQAWGEDYDARQVLGDIEDFPAADVRPVVRGEWMRGNAYPHHVYCSNCYCTYIPNDRWQIWVDKCGDGGVPRDYCPNCGADNREEVQG